MSHTTEIDRYRIVDEPKRKLLNRLALPPLLPFVALMVAWPWGILAFAFNSVALNGPSKWRELGFCVSAIVSVYLVIFLIAVSVETSPLDDYWHAYAKVAAMAVSLWFAYKIYLSQKTTHDLRTYFQSLRGRS